MKLWEKRSHPRKRNSSWHVGEKRTSTRGRERDHFQRRRDQIQFAKAQKTRQQSCSTFFKNRAVLYGSYSRPYSLVQAVLQHLSLKFIFWHNFQDLYLLLCGRTAHRNRGTARHDFQERFAKGRGRTVAFIAGTFPLVCCTFLSDFSQYILA